MTCLERPTSRSRRKAPRAAVLEGVGIGYLLEDDVRDEIAAGRLLRLLDETASDVGAGVARTLSVGLGQDPASIDPCNAPGPGIRTVNLLARLPKADARFCPGRTG